MAAGHDSSQPASPRQALTRLDRLPDIVARMHAAAKGRCLWLTADNTSERFVFSRRRGLGSHRGSYFLTSEHPIAAHMIGRASLEKNAGRTSGGAAHICFLPMIGWLFKRFFRARPCGAIGRLRTRHRGRVLVLLTVQGSRGARRRRRSW